MAVAVEVAVAVLVTKFSFPAVGVAVAVAVAVTVAEVPEGVKTGASLLNSAIVRIVLLINEQTFQSTRVELLLTKTKTMHAAINK
jgi:hypothetical protein